MKSFWSDFKAFISKGNILDMAVGVIIGGAFSAIVSSLVDDIISPLIGLILGGIDFSGLSFKVGDASVNYGSFISAVINFLIVALVLFCVLRAVVKSEERIKQLVNKDKKDEGREERRGEEGNSGRNPHRDKRSAQGKFEENEIGKISVKDSVFIRSFFSRRKKNNLILSVFSID